ncbi:MAG: hypothetical protein QM730_09660 [Anaerolineales bacterium]
MKSNLSNALERLKEGLSKYLQPFADNGNLKDLLTLHQSYDENSQWNFAILKQGEYFAISDEEIQNYIRLTRSVTRLSAPIGSIDDFLVGYESTAPDPYIGFSSSV